MGDGPCITFSEKLKKVDSFAHLFPLYEVFMKINVKHLPYEKVIGSGLDKVFKTTVFIKDMNDFGKINAVYATYFDGDYP
ncbi:MAG: hypothetical protein J6B86_05565, partial [Clostridia bacterium]|nr:hypothetical protein [Clostridia bacterium]